MKTITQRKTMQALTFVAPGKIELREKPVPSVGFGKALIRITTTTICGTDVHTGQRVIAGAIELFAAQ